LGENSMGKKFKCKCGSIFSSIIKPGDKSVVCPNCCSRRKLPKHLRLDEPKHSEFENQHPPQMEQTSLPSGASNSLGSPRRKPAKEKFYSVTGFILSIFSFLLLAPIALFFCIRGLKEKDGKGFAVAGLIISILQTVSLFGVIGYIVFPFVLNGIDLETVSYNSKEADIHQRTKKTFRAFEEGYQQTAAFEKKNGRKPDISETRAITSKINDGWGNPLGAENSAGGVFLHSSGPDGVFGTRDDVTKNSVDSEDEQLKKYVKKRSERPILFGIKPTIEGALIQIESNEHSGISSGLDMLQVVEVDEAKRSKVLNTIRPLLFNSSHVRKARYTYKLWANKSDIPLLIKQMEKAIKQSHDQRQGEGVVELLSSFRAKDAILDLINHYGRTLREDAKEWIQENNVSNESICEQCLKDMKKQDRATFAMYNLAKLEAIPEYHKKVILAVKPYLTNEGRNDPNVPLSVLENWKPIPAILDELIKLDALEHIIKIKDKRVFDYLIRGFGARPAKASGGILKIGPAAEPSLSPLLSGYDTLPKERAIQLLVAIGTERSIPKLEKLVDKKPGNRMVEDALNALRKSTRKSAPGEFESNT